MASSRTKGLLVVNPQRNTVPPGAAEREIVLLKSGSPPASRGLFRLRGSFFVWSSRSGSCPRSTTAEQRRDSGPPPGSRSRPPIDPLRHPVASCARILLRWPHQLPEARPVVDRPSWCASTEAASAVALSPSSTPNRASRRLSLTGSTTSAIVYSVT
jgi:hypothetical protein